MNNAFNASRALSTPLQRQVSKALNPASPPLTIEKLGWILRVIEAASSRGDDARLDSLDIELTSLRRLHDDFEREVKELLIEKVMQGRVALHASDVDHTLFLAKCLEPDGHAALAQRYGLQPRYLQARLLRRRVWPEVWANAFALVSLDAGRPCDRWPDFFDDLGHWRNQPQQSAAACRVRH